ncbi:MAG: hypothetical protein A2W93_01460 [Bacteroidetes bacterium GWF2_43_63]|nr:MAG: hypothetical protein A2W94_10610 [Bacteroidetes bacterium GWE2_42_42]OFY55737.1 MAG: hypothetical protein A2W93_01460 [Bacteroidetes bacterium GWF2_43_63]HBG71350.1 hypothetical protein [Bacteroidales bacterium]HCB60430.1 hypothetical protein [Bacteroidales bacterium]HCY22613.1 hypothetical protein [Bacteroidales bacterium]
MKKSFQHLNLSRSGPLFKRECKGKPFFITANFFLIFFGPAFFSSNDPLFQRECKGKPFFIPNNFFWIFFQFFLRLLSERSVCVPNGSAKLRIILYLNNFFELFLDYYLNH